MCHIEQGTCVRWQIDGLLNAPTIGQRQYNKAYNTTVIEDGVTLLNFSINKTTKKYMHTFN